MATNGAMVTPPKWTTQEIALHFFDFTKRSITLGRKGLVDLGRCYLYQLSVILRFFVVLCGFDPHINQIHTKRRGAFARFCQRPGRTMTRHGFPAGWIENTRTVCPGRVKKKHPRQTMYSSLAIVGCNDLFFYGEQGRMFFAQIALSRTERHPFCKTGGDRDRCRSPLQGEERWMGVFVQNRGGLL